MNIKNKIKEKKEYLQKLVNDFQLTQKQTQQLNDEILRTDGAIKQLEDLENENIKEKGKK